MKVRSKLIIFCMKLIGGAEGGTPESVNPSVVDEEEGLPSPPLDDLTFFATQPTSMEFSQVFAFFHPSKLS